MWSKKLFQDAMTSWTAVGAISTSLAVIIALFGDKIKAIFWGPKLDIQHENRIPFNKYAKFSDESGKEYIGYYLRLKITNSGGSTLKGVYGKLNKVEYDGKNSSIDTFDPCVLRWVGTQKCEPQDLSAKDTDYMDVVFAVRDTSYFHPNTDFILKGSPYSFKKELNPHILHLKIFSDNARTVDKKYRLTFNEQLDFDSANLELV